MKDIQNREDVVILINAFYGKVREDELLGHIFQDRIKDNWSTHLDKMYKFWSTILLDEHSYSGAPFAPHMTMGIDNSHFQRWLTLFFETVDELFEGEKSEEAKWRAVNMGKNFSSKLEYMRNNPLYKH